MIDRIAATPNIEVVTGIEVAAVRGNGRLEKVVIRGVAGGEEREASTRSGARPRQPGSGAANRLDREIPSERTIRFYTTEGLIDEPAGMLGHMALYGRRHLLQLLAIKRLQAEGASLEQIRQRQLRQLSTRVLDRLARGRAPVHPSLSRGKIESVADGDHLQ